MCGFGSQVGKQHQRNRLPALLETREPVVDEQGNPNKPKIDGTPPLPLKGEGKLVLARKTKLAPRVALCAVLTAR